MHVTGSINQAEAPNIPVIDYEGSQYRANFWVGQGRAYEDAAERIALQRLVPVHGGRIAEIGAGFGRLANLYQGYEQIILFDYSRTLLQDADLRQRLGAAARQRAVDQFDLNRIVQQNMAFYRQVLEATRQHE